MPTQPTRAGPRHVVLVGLMGAGKSTVGRRLADRLGCPLRDSDADLRAATGLSVRELRDRDGVEVLHALEAGQLLDALDAEPPSVIAAAASVVDGAGSTQAMAAPDVFVVWLRADPGVLAGRFDEPDDHRPAYGDAPEVFLAHQFEVRGPALAAVADAIIDVDDRSPDDVVQLIVKALG